MAVVSWRGKAHHAQIRAQRVAYAWPVPVHAATKGYESDVGAVRFAWRSVLEGIATISDTPGLDRWVARWQLLVGRSDTDFVAMRPRSVFEFKSVKSPELWRSPIGSATVTSRTRGVCTVVDFGGHAVLIPTDEIQYLFGEEG